MRDIETALVRQKAGPNRIPQALIAELMATEASMEGNLRALSLDALRDVATWTSGSFAVYDGVVPPPFVHTALPDVPSVLIEAFRGQCQREALQKEFVSRKGILRVRAVSRDTSALSDAEKAVLLLANGERTIDDILKRCGLDEFQALSAMHVLCALHVTDLLPPQRVSKASVERPAPASPPSAPAAEPAGAPPRAGAASEVPARAEPAKAGLPAEPKPKASGPAHGSAESTAKLHALPDISTPGPPVRTLRIVGDDKTREVSLTASTFAIGRHPRNDLVLKDPRISSFHCRIEIEGDKYIILDLKSRNGTLLNSTRIDRAVLKANDIIQLGSTKISYFEN
jgi:hypothetical protein